MAELTYKQWLEKAIDKADKAYHAAEENYQETGGARYYSAMKNKEYEAQAYRDALTAENGIDKHIEGWRRHISSLIDNAENAKELLPPEEALDGIVKELYKLKWI